MPTLVKMAPGDGTRARLAIEADKREAARLIKLAAGTIIPGETIKARMRRTVQVLGWSYNRVRDIWQQHARRIDAHEMDQLRAFSKVIPPENSDSC